MLSELAWKRTTQPAERGIERDRKTVVVEAMDEDARVAMTAVARAMLTI